MTRRLGLEPAAFSERANKHRIDLFVIDHLLHASGLYGMPWLEPLTTLMYASAIATDVRVGTGIGPSGGEYRPTDPPLKTWEN